MSRTPYLPKLLLAGCILGKLVPAPTAAGAYPLEHLKTFSAFASVDPRSLQAGEILGEPGSLMKFPNGISAETCFLVPLPAAEAAKRLQLWDPSLRGTLKTLEFHPISNSCSIADFQNLILKPDIRAQRWLLEKTVAPLGRNSELNLTRDEARQLGDSVKASHDPPTVSAGWSRILLGRALEFQRHGFADMPPYELSGQTVQPAAQLRAMATERPSVAREFASLLRQCGVLEDKGAATIEPFYYWALYEANHHATLTLGALYLLPLSDRFQLLDAEYYVSGTYYTFITLYDVWPVQGAGKAGALVWRGDFFSAPTLAYTQGVERLAYGAFMLQEVKKTIRSFQHEVLNSRIGPGTQPPH
jgi:hypothetical protein